MPTYLCHGFRWSRRNIRVYVVVQDIDDAAPEWIVKSGSSKAILESFYSLFEFLPACVPPSSEKVQSRRAFNHANYYNMYNEPHDRGRGQGMGGLSTPRSRSYSIPRQSPLLGVDEAGSNSQHRSQNEQTSRFRGYSNLEGREKKKQQYRLFPVTKAKPRSQSETRDLRNPYSKGVQRLQINSIDRPNQFTWGQRNRASSTSSSSITMGGNSNANRWVGAPLLPFPNSIDNDLKNEWSAVQLLEEYDSSKISNVSQDYAYVADYVVRVDLSMSVMDEMARYEKRQRAGDGAMSGPADESFGRATHNHKTSGGSDSSSKAGWFEKLRDQLQRGEDIKWYIVVCEDEEREGKNLQETVSSKSTTELITHTIQSVSQTAAEQAGYEGKSNESRMYFGQPPREPNFEVGTEAEREGFRELEEDYDRRRKELRMQFGQPPKMLGFDIAIETERERLKGLAKEEQQCLFHIQTQDALSVPEKDRLSLTNVAGPESSMDLNRSRSSKSSTGLRRLFSRSKLVEQRGGNSRHV